MLDLGYFNNIIFCAKMVAPLPTFLFLHQNLSIRSLIVLGNDSYKFLEKFLNTTKANLFFAKGVILVEGWAEEILIPSIAKAIRINLTKRGEECLKKIGVPYIEINMTKRPVN